MSGAGASSETGKLPRWVGHDLNRGGTFAWAEAICRTVPRPLLYPAVRLVMEWACRRLDGPRNGVRANLAVVAPELGPRELRRAVRRTFRNYGRCVADYLRWSNRPQIPLESLFSRVEGMEMCLGLLGEGRGLILAAAHLGNWELGGLVFSRFGQPMNVLAAAEEDPDVERMRRDKRGDRGIRTLYVGQDLATLFRVREVLRRGEVVVLLGDRLVGREGLEVEFFGRPTTMMRAPALLARMSGAPVVPAFIPMDGRGRYQAVIDQVLRPEVGGGGGREADRRFVQELARSFERQIRARPDQWFNFYPFWG